MTITVRAGDLLVATPELLDPSFADTLVLMLDVDEEGSLGVVLNHPTSVPVADVLEAWRSEVSHPEVLFHGGPVGPDGALALAQLRDPLVQPMGWRQVFSDIGIIDLDTPVELLSGTLKGLRVYAGYAGWGAGQLEAEISEGSWYVVPAESDDVLCRPSDGLLRDVLRRQPGEAAWRSTRPIDPGLN